MAETLKKKQNTFMKVEKNMADLLSPNKVLYYKLYGKLRDSSYDQELDACKACMCVWGVGFVLLWSHIHRAHDHFLAVRGEYMQC